MNTSRSATASMLFCVRRGLALRIHEAQLARGELAVNRQRGAGDGAGAERANVGVLGHIEETRAVAREHLHVGEQMVRDGDGLRALQVGVAGQNGRLVGLRLRDQRAQQIAKRAVKLRARPFEPQAHGGGHLVVAAAAGVELGGGGRAPAQRVLDVHVHVLERGVPREGSGLNFGENGVEAAHDGIALGGGEQAGLGEHFRVGLRTGDVERREPAVEGNRLAELQHQRGRAGREAPAPRRLRGGAVARRRVLAAGLCLDFPG